MTLLNHCIMAWQGSASKLLALEMLGWRLAYSDMPPIHDLSKDVLQISPWHLGRVIQEILGYNDARAQIARVEWVRTLPADGAKLTSFADD